MANTAATPTMLQMLRARLRQWLMGPELVAEIKAAAQRLNQLGAETDAQAAAARSAGADSGAGSWVALPGGRLELVAPQLSGCGFYITLDTRPGHAPYSLFTPEGDRIAWGHTLAFCKAHGERMAAERAEFDYTPPSRRT